MEDCQKVKIILLIFVSVLLFASSLVWLFVRYIRGRLSPGMRKKAGVSTALIFTLFLILSVFLLRFAIGYFGVVTNTEESAPSLGEEFFNSVLKTFRTFSMEEEYYCFINDVKLLMKTILPAECSSCWNSLMVFYTSVLNLLAPIVSGAILLEILASIFPKIKLKLSYLNIRRPKYYFSELNEASLTLAKSIILQKKVKKPVLIFTDTYIDKENEKDYELFIEAKRYGAICIRDDLAHVSKSKVSKNFYYLIDENEQSNLNTLIALTENNNVKYIKKAHIYLFVQSDSYIRIEKQIREQLNKDELPIISPINSYHNLICNLLEEVPLYEPLVNRKDVSELNVTIFGNGTIGTEAFLTTYWLGQMMISKEKDDCKTMEQCKLNINVVSNDNEKTFWSKIAYINPEIRETIEVDNSQQSEMSKQLLAFDNKGNKNSYYCNVNYIESDVKVGSFWNEKDKDYRQIINTDYFIVALGNDKDNISVAERLRCLIGKKNINVTNEKEIKNTVIAYAVFDSKLSKLLNKHKYYQCRKKDKTDIFMYSFGSLEEVYCYDNVNMSTYSTWAKIAGNAYTNLSKQREFAHIRDNKARGENNEDSNYEFWANLAKTVHAKYKVYSLGWINTSVFDCLTEEACEEHRKNVAGQCNLYRTFAVLKEPEILIQEDREKYRDIELKKHCLAWLEHRRWCAFTRTMGYQFVNVDNILMQSDEKKNKKHKEMSLKLHACLVEARLPKIKGPGCKDFDCKYILADFDKSGKIDDKTVLQEINEAYLDCLDNVSYARKNVKGKSGDFKEYDFYRYELDGFKFESEIIGELERLNIKNPKRYCDHKLFENAISCKTVEGEKYLISINDVKSVLEEKYRIVLKNEEVKCLFEFGNDKYTTKFRYRLSKVKRLMKKNNNC